jgi:hypothetical protein
MNILKLDEELKELVEDINIYCEGLEKITM